MKATGLQNFKRKHLVQFSLRKHLHTLKKKLINEAHCLHTEGGPNE